MRIKVITSTALVQRHDCEKAYLSKQLALFKNQGITLRPTKVSLYHGGDGYYGVLTNVNDGYVVASAFYSLQEVS